MIGFGIHFLTAVGYVTVGATIVTYLLPPVWDMLDQSFGVEMRRDNWLAVALALLWPVTTVLVGLCLCCLMVVTIRDRAEEQKRP
jgi:hypothetical protein